MAERSTDRAPSVSSSVTEAEAFDDNEKGTTPSSSNGSYVILKTPDELEIGDDVERAGLLPGDQEKPAQPQLDNSAQSAVIWMVVNTLATIGIVSVGI